LASFKAQLGARFKIKDIGDISQLIGKHITHERSARPISFDHSKDMRNILAKHGMTEGKPSYLPMDPGFVSGLARVDSLLLTGMGKDIYPNLLGSLMYAPVCTHPNVSTTLSILGSAVAKPTEVHLQALEQGTIKLRYLPIH
jgi:hypothetical protein